MKCNVDIRPLKDLADIQTGPFGSQLHKEDYVEVGTPIVTVEHLGNRIFTEQNLPKVSDGDRKRLEKYLLSTGDIVFSRVGSVDRCSYVDEWHSGWMFSGRCLRIRPSECINPLYLYYYFCLEEVRQFVRNIAVGATMPSINTKLLGEVPVSVPSIQTQRRIAAILSSLDDKIELNNKINANLERQAQALFKAWFVDFEPFGGSKPRTWVETDIYQLANVIYGAPFKSAQFNTKGIGTPIIRIRDLKEQQFATYTTEVHPKGYLLRPGDLVVGMDGEFRPYIWGNGEAWLNQRVCVFEPKRPKGKMFLYCLIKPLLFACERMQVATTVIHIGKKDFDTFRFTLPTEDVLEMFDALTTPLYDMIVSNKQENRRLAEIRDTLLPHLLARGTQTQQQRN